MVELDRDTAKTLESMDVRIDVRDHDTVILRRLPVNADCYSKDSTNLLLKRARRSTPFMICVDEDLAYTGDDRGIMLLFARGVTRRGWRTLYIGRSCGQDLTELTREVMTLLGSDGAQPIAPGSEPAPQAAGDDSLLSAFGTNLSELAREGKLAPTIARDDETRLAAACLLRAGQAGMALLAGPSGVGKTNLFGAVATMLLEPRADWNVVLIDLAQPFAGSAFDAEAESVLAAICDQAAGRDDLVLALDHAEQILATPRGVFLLGRYLDSRGRIIAATGPAAVRHFAQGPLRRRIQLVRICEMSPEQTLGVLEAHLSALCEHHRVEIAPSCLTACLRATARIDGCLPAKALGVLDAAAARSCLSGGKVVGPDDIFFAAEGLKAFDEEE